MNGSSSGVLPVISGMPQGFVLWPLLFIFYINSTMEVRLSDGIMSLYADDIMLYQPIYSATDYHRLQMDIDKSGLLPVSIGLYKSVKYVKQRVGSYSEEVLSLCKYFITWN